MSLYQKASLVQIPSGTKVNKLYSVVPNNGDGDFTGTAIDGDATRINKDGLVENVSTNVARLNYDPTNPQDPHLLIEPARTNRVFPNNSLTGYSTIGVTKLNRSEEHTSELQSRLHLVCRLLLEQKKKQHKNKKQKKHNKI